MKEIAARIKELIWEYDPYEFGDAFASDMDAVERIECLLGNQEGVDILISYMDEIGSELPEMAKEAKRIKKIIEQMGPKVRINKIFTVVRGEKRMRWKVIEHPYFHGQLTLVRDYPGMSNTYRKEDDEHINGAVTLENAYDTAYLMT